MNYANDFLSGTGYRDLERNYHRARRLHAGIKDVLSANSTARLAAGSKRVLAELRTMTRTQKRQNTGSSYESGDIVPGLYVPPNPKYQGSKKDFDYPYNFKEWNTIAYQSNENECQTIAWRIGDRTSFRLYLQNKIEIMGKNDANTAQRLENVNYNIAADSATDNVGHKVYHMKENCQFRFKNNRVLTSDNVVSGGSVIVHMAVVECVSPTNFNPLAKVNSVIQSDLSDSAAGNYETNPNYDFIKYFDTAYVSKYYKILKRKKVVLKPGQETKISTGIGILENPHTGYNDSNLYDKGTRFFIIRFEGDIAHGSTIATETNVGLAPAQIDCVYKFQRQLGIKDSNFRVYQEQSTNGDSLAAGFVDDNVDK